MERIKLFLADDHSLIREGFKALLGQNELFEIVGEAENGKELIQRVPETLPDIVLIDISMPQLSGLEAMEILTGKFPALNFIILTMHEEREYVLRGLRAGAKGYLLKSAEKTEIERAINTVHQGGKYFSPAISTVLADAVRPPDVPDHIDLTARENEVLALVADGFSTKQIADKLSISIRTVESHRINMLKKMNVSNTAELIKKSIYLKLIDIHHKKS